MFKGSKEEKVKIYDLENSSYVFLKSSKQTEKIEKNQTVYSTKTYDEYRREIELERRIRDDKREIRESEKRIEITKKEIIELEKESLEIDRRIELAKIKSRELDKLLEQLKLNQKKRNLKQKEQIIGIE